MRGKELLQAVVTNAGLPEEPLTRELQSLLSKATVSDENCSLDDLREILANYLQDVILESKTTLTG